MNRKRILAVAAVVVVAVALYFILRHRGDGGTLTASGTVEATDAQLGFQAPGRIDTILVDEGYRVKAGQELARLDQTELRARRGQAAAQLGAAQALLSELEHTRADFRFYELPTIESRNIFSRTFINEGMRMGIPDPATRERTITLYIDKKAFKSALELPDEEHTYLLLTDQAGNVLWRTSGAYSPEKAAELVQAVETARIQLVEAL